MVKRRKTVTFLVLSVLIGSLMGCSLNESTTAEKKSIYRVEGEWPRPPLFQGNYFANGGVGTAAYFVFEGLVQNVRMVDDQYLRLAETVTYLDDRIEIKIKEDANWQDGTPFTSKDVWAYYMLNRTEATDFYKEIELIDDKTLTIHLLDPYPNKEVIRFLFGADLHGTVPYHLHSEYVDRAAELLETASTYSIDEQKIKKGKFGLNIDEDLDGELNENWNYFLKSGPDMPMGTGPYAVSRVTSSDMLLEKQEDYYRADDIAFDQITIKNPGDGAAGYALIRSGQLNQFDGTPARDILESLVSMNDDIVHYKYPDPASIGMFFNQSMEHFDQKEFRQAISYAIDREKVREVGNNYGQVPTTSITGVVPSQLVNWIDEGIYDELTDYTYNLGQAEEILYELGWERNAQGVWEDPDGHTQDYVIGVNSGSLNMVMPAQIVAEQLTEFGLPTRLLAVDGTIFYKNAENEEGGLYHMSVDYIDTAWGFTYPWHSIRDVFWGGQSRMMHLPRYASDHEDFSKRGKLDLQLTSHDGITFDVEEILHHIPYMDKEEYTAWFSRLAWLINENAYGLNFYQNTTGTWMNRSNISGLPYEDEIDQYGGDMPLMEDEAKMREALETNLFFAGIIPFLEGRYQPKEGDDSE
ncbi:ABC transporter substrate-binding protein [Shouchella miscanthi]|uniref:ABC transporter substrate-binding protein n=1 Tax=Shouchella miscanthi TaxID=2598861 RepID=A0ABU6NN40_9BACI|nr:ABC transporter substrate-binding protein [Shouchella miscanthi]